jgi:hypothetical protein
MTLPRKAQDRPLSARVVAALLTANILVAGCSTVSPRYDADFIETAALQNRPVLPPIRSVSGFTDSLVCMDRMLGDYRVPKVVVTSKFIPDATAKVNVATKEMAITALQVMSRESGTLVYLENETDMVKKDTVGTLVSMLFPAGQMQVPRPQIYLSGAVTFMDQNIVVERNSVGMSFKSMFDVGASKDRFASVIGLDLHLGNFNTLTLFQGVSSANQITVANAAAGVDSGGRINKAGVQFSLGREVSQGAGTAVRTLIELGLVELIGKWAKVPYWQCLALDQAHPEFQHQLRDWWEAMPSEERIKLFQTGLRSQQYFQGNGDGRPSVSLRNALMRYQADQHLIVTGNATFETYERLVRDYVVFDGEGNFVRIGWGAPGSAVSRAKGGGAGSPPTAQEISAMAPRSGQRSFDDKSPHAVDVQLRLNDHDGQMRVGEKLVVNVVLERQAWLHCYYKDVRGRVSQIYPNPLQTQQPVQAHAQLSVPDTGLTQTFTLDLTKPGDEEVACLATERDPRVKLPPELRGPALEPLVDMKNVADVQKAFTDAMAGSVPVGMSRQRYLVTR